MFQGPGSGFVFWFSFCFRVQGFGFNVLNLALWNSESTRGLPRSNAPNVEPEPGTGTPNENQNTNPEPGTRNMEQLTSLQ
jgi:hypothetical protein